MDLCNKKDQQLKIREMNSDHVFPSISQTGQSLSNWFSSEGTSYRNLSAKNPTLTYWLPAESNSDKTSASKY